MARIKNGLISGKIGEVVHYQVKGKQFLRKRPQREAPPTEGELHGQDLLKVVNSWVKPLLEFVRIGFRGYNERYEGWNAAVSVVHREALQRDGDTYWVDPAKARVSHGSLPLAKNLQAQLQPGGRVDFSWDPSGVSGCSPRDRVMLLAYNVEEHWPAFELSGPKRHEGLAWLPLSGNVPGTYHLYAAFVSEDGEEQSESRYLGVVEIA